MELPVAQAETFQCAYSKKPLVRPCEVESCVFNMPATSLATHYRRCFLNYVDKLRHNPYKVRTLATFAEASPEQKEQITAAFFGVTLADIQKVTTSFYTSLLSVLSFDTTSSLANRQVSPVPYRQCAVCGTACEREELFLPKSGVLPPGYGYCSYPCYQLKPPPILHLECILHLDYRQFLDNLQFDRTKNRKRFVTQLIRWVIGGIAMK